MPSSGRLVPVVTCSLCLITDLKICWHYFSWMVQFRRIPLPICYIYFLCFLQCFWEISSSSIDEGKLSASGIYLYAWRIIIYDSWQFFSLFFRQTQPVILTVWENLVLYLLKIFLYVRYIIRLLAFLYLITSTCFYLAKGLMLH